MIDRDLLGVRRGLLATCAALLIAGGVIAGCGDDDDEGDGGGGGDTAAQELTGEPVTVYFQAPIDTEVSDNTDALAAVNAAADAINEDGGLNGSEVRVESCNDTDANAELECVRRATQGNALAFVGSSFVFNPKAGQAALAEASIPSVAPLAIQQVEYGSPINFPIYTTSFGILACPQQTTDVTDARSVAGIAQDLPVQNELLMTLQAIAGATGVDYGGNVAVPQSQTDFSSAVQELADTDAEAVVNVLVPPSQPAFFTAIRSVGEEFTAYCSVPSNITYDILGQLGDQADDYYVSTGLPPTNEASAEELPLVQEFRDEMEAAADAGDDAANLDNLQSPGNALNGWLGMQVLQQVAADVNGELTSEKLLAALNRAQVDLERAGLPPIDFSEPVPAPGFERLFNPIVTLTKWDSGEGDFVATDAEPVNVLELFAALEEAGAGQ